MGEKPSFSPNLAMVLSIAAVSTASIMIRVSHAPPLAIAAYRMIFSTLMLLPWFIQSKGARKVAETGKTGILKLAAVGLVLAVHFASWITSINMTSVASSVVFVHIDPVFVALVSHFLLGERITTRTALGIAVALAGATLIALGDFGLELNLLGDALALIGGLMLGIYILAGRQLRQNLDLVSYVTPVYATSALVLVAASLFYGVPLAGYAPREYVIFFAIALVPMIFGHTVYNWALRYVTAPVVSISLLGEPVGASILAYLILSEVPGTKVILGGIITLVGILICAYRAE